MPSRERLNPDTLSEMTLEEIERESAKLSEEERSRLAARLLEKRDLPVTHAADDEADRCICPSCQKPTKRIEIEVESSDWGRVYFLGILSALHPDKERSRVCEHCGRVFDRTLVTNPVADRVITFLFFAILGAGIIGLIVMFVQRTMV
jgi:hypothetical protein